MTVNNLPFICPRFDCVFYDQECELCCFCVENDPTNYTDKKK